MSSSTTANVLSAATTTYLRPTRSSTKRWQLLWCLLCRMLWLFPVHGENTILLLSVWNLLRCCSLLITCSTGHTHKFSSIERFLVTHSCLEPHLVFCSRIFHFFHFWTTKSAPRRFALQKFEIEDIQNKSNISHLKILKNNPYIYIFTCPLYGFTLN